MEDQQQRAWHAMSCQQTEEVLQTSEEGLSDAEAAKRLEKYGKNVLMEVKPKSIWKMILEQISDVMVIILFIAMVFSLVMNFIDGEGLAEAIVIFCVIVLNAAVGVIQEKKAADALESLKKMTAPNARVLRDGEESIVPASELVPGDIVYLEDGAIVPADIRIINDNNMSVQEPRLPAKAFPRPKTAPPFCPKTLPSATG